MMVMIFIDGWNYFKHSSLHSPLLWHFHRSHHGYKKPSAFSSFSVGPLESFWTFCPMLIDMFDEANYFKLYIYIHIGMISTFFIFNMYLHCGYTFDIVESILPRLFINSSEFHNFH